MTTRTIRKAYDELQKQYDGRTVVNGVTQDQAAALQGNTGSPSDSNRYLTELDGASYVTGPAVAVDNNLAQFNLTTGKLIEDSGISNADTASAVSLKHTRSHAITGTSDHTSTATSGKILKADANGLPIDATNTDAQVSAAVTASHSNALDHTQGTDTGTSNATFDVGGIKFFGKSIQLADHATQVLTTVGATYPAHGFVQVCTTSAITESAEFEMGSDGTVNLIRGTANIVANVDTTAKFCIGTSAAQNPLTIKNHLEATVQAIIQFWHG